MRKESCAKVVVGLSVMVLGADAQVVVPTKTINPADDGRNCEYIAITHPDL